VSTQHSPDITLEKLREEVMEKVIKAVLPAEYLDERTVYHINPCGNFIIGGPLVRSLYISHLIHFFCSLIISS
jgi:S-adenosylmethionine synthetase